MHRAVPAALAEGLCALPNLCWSVYGALMCVFVFFPPAVALTTRRCARRDRHRTQQRTGTRMRAYTCRRWNVDPPGRRYTTRHRPIGRNPGWPEQPLCPTLHWRCLLTHNAAVANRGRANPQPCHIPLSLRRPFWQPPQGTPDPQGAQHVPRNTGVLRQPGEIHPHDVDCQHQGFVQMRKSTTWLVSSVGCSGRGADARLVLSPKGRCVILETSHRGKCRHLQCPE